MKITVTPQKITETPVSALLCGNFIELGYGLQVEPMWGEMLFNRSFEPFYPYQDINIAWFELWSDENDPSQGYKTDWTHEDWYHSGYEHNAWFAAPGQEGPFHIDDQSTFLIAKSLVRNVEIALSEDARHGTHALRLINHEAAHWGGAAQQGKWLTAGETYRFRGWMKAEGLSTQAEVRLYPEGDWETPLAVMPLGEIEGEWTEKTADLYNTNYEGRATFCLFIAPQSAVRLDDFSLMPASAVQGWRREVVETVRQLAPKVVRFPGGCFASFYDWRDGVGSPSQRKPQPSYFWGGLNYNDVGTAELAWLCREAGAEMMICVNLFHPFKQKYEHHLSEASKHAHGFDFPHFTDLQEGAKLAADWVAYCNLPAGTHPMADLRAEHGYPEPFGVGYWEMDNEVSRWFQPEEYARAVVVYSRAMKAVDPTIKIGLVTYDTAFTDKLETMLEIAGADADFFADRRIGEQNTRMMLDRMRAWNAAHGTKLAYCNTEWLPYDFEPDAFNNLKMDGVTKSFLFSKWRYALNILRTHLMWQRQGGDVLFVNFNNLANTHSQCALDTPKEGAFLTASGRALELLAYSPAAWPLALEGYTPDDRAEFQVQAAWDQERARLVLSVLNMKAEPQSVQFDLAPLDRAWPQAHATILQADSLLAMNTLAHPDSIRREVRQEVVKAGGVFTVAAPPFSFTETVLSEV